MDDEIFPISHGGDDSSTEFVVEQVDSVDKISYGMCAQIGDWIEAQNNRKGIFKAMASKVFFGAIVGLGYLFSGKESGLVIETSILMFAFAIIASLVVDAAWFLNHGVYHREIAILYHAAIELESKDPEDQGFRNMGLLLHSRHSDPSVFDIGIFLLFSLVLKLIGVVSLFDYLYGFQQHVNSSEVIAIFASFVILTGFTIASFIFSRKSGNPRLKDEKFLKRKKSA